IIYKRQHEGGKLGMSTIWVVLIAIAALIAGVALGFFIARKYMMSYLKKNPPINEQMLRTLMMQMGQKPSQKKINQMMRAMNNQNQSGKYNAIIDIKWAFINDYLNVKDNNIALYPFPLLSQEGVFSLKAGCIETLFG